MTAAVSAPALAGGERCMLHTDLANLTSNTICLALGHRAVGEDVAVRFGPVPNPSEKGASGFLRPRRGLLALPAKASTRAIVLDHIA